MSTERANEQPKSEQPATEQPAAVPEASPAQEPAVASEVPVAAEDLSASRKRDRSPAEAHHHHHHHHRDEKGGSRHETKSLSAAAKKESELSPDTCLRYGVFEPRREISREEFMDEMEAIRMMGSVEQIVLEPFNAGQDRYCWARIYFNSKENADMAATELNIPLRKSKWRLSVTQRLPLKGPSSGEIGTIPAFQPFSCDLSDTVVVDTQEGYVAFSTDELYHSRSASEFIEAKRNGRLIRRLICKHFDAERRIPCRYGVGCSFMHIKAGAVDRLLRTVSHKAPLRFTKQDEDIQVGTWEYERRHDTLLVRHLADEMTETELSYMFQNCPGFRSCCVFASKDDKTRAGARFGLIRFDSKAAAMATLLQTHDSNLNIGFFGVMEDIRRMQMHAVKDAKVLPSNFDTSQQTHILFNVQTNQVIGQTNDRDRRPQGYTAPNYNNNNGNNSYKGNQYQRQGGQQQQQQPANNGASRGGYTDGSYSKQENQGRSHDYGNDRYNSNNTSNSGYQPTLDGPLQQPRTSSNGGGGGGGQAEVGSLFAAPQANSSSANDSGKTPEAVPFPPLPSGWGYGVSRRTGKYFFFEHGSKAPTTFKHPSTGEKYGGT